MDCLSRLWFPRGCRSLRKLLIFHLSQEAGVNTGAQSGTPNPREAASHIQDIFLPSGNTFTDTLVVQCHQVGSEN